MNVAVDLTLWIAMSLWQWSLWESLWCSSLRTMPHLFKYQTRTVPRWLSLMTPIAVYVEHGLFPLSFWRCTATQCPMVSSPMGIWVIFSEFLYVLRSQYMTITVGGIWIGVVYASGGTMASALRTHQLKFEKWLFFEWALAVQFLSIYWLWLWFVLKEQLVVLLVFGVLPFAVNE